MACGRYCALGEGRRERKKEKVRDGERAGGERMGDGLGGGRAGITIKQPLTAHTTPEQLTEELQRRGGGRGEWAADGGEQTCSLSRNDGTIERHVKQRGYYCGAGQGPLQLSGTPENVELEALRNGLTVPPPEISKRSVKALHPLCFPTW